MAANDVIFTRILGPEVGVKNTDASNDLVAGNTVTLDGSNLVSTTQPQIGVKRATADDKPFGICLEAIAKGKVGRVLSIYHAIGVTFASGVVTAGDSCECDTAGKVKTSAGSKAIVGDALTTTASDGDQLLLGMPGHAVV